MQNLSQLLELIATDTEVNEQKATDRKDKLLSVAEQLQQGKQICNEAIEFLQSIEDAAKKAKKNNEFVDFYINLSAQFHNLAVINPSASLPFVSKLKETYSNELSKINIAIQNIQSITH